MIIYVEDSAVKVGGVVLPGIFKSMEVTREAAIDEVEVAGAAVKPKQAVGYEDGRVKLELILGATAKQTLEDKVAAINNLFRAKGQNIPQPFNIVSKETAAARIDLVLFQKLTTKGTNKNDQVAVTMEFCEYVPQTITVAASGSAASGGAGADTAANLTGDYQNYLNSRGTAPRIGDKTAATPAIDDRVYSPEVQSRLERPRA